MEKVIEKMVEIVIEGETQNAVTYNSSKRKVVLFLKVSGK